MPVTIRDAVDADLPAILEIYNEAGVGTTASYDLRPATLEERAAWLADKRRHGHPVFVCCDADHVIGFGAYGGFRSKAGYDYTVEHTVYVRDGWRGAGIGRVLMNALIERARASGVHVMIGCLDADNDASIAFHRRLGFVEVGRMPEVGRKFGRWLDAVFVQLTLPEDAVRLAHDQR